MTEQIENMELLKAFEEMRETQTGSLAVNMKSMQEDIKANQAKADVDEKKGRLKEKLTENIC
jgi:hypothetical protein